MAGLQFHVISPVDSELPSDQDDVQSILRPLAAQCFAYGKYSIIIWKHNKSQLLENYLLLLTMWIVHENPFPSLGCTAGRFFTLLCSHRTMSLPMEQERNWCVSFQTWPIITSHMHFSMFLPLLLMDADGDEVLGMEEAQDGKLWVPDWPREGVQSPQCELWCVKCRVMCCWNFGSCLVIQHKLTYTQKFSS